MNARATGAGLVGLALGFVCGALWVREAKPAAQPGPEAHDEDGARHRPPGDSYAEAARLAGAEENAADHEAAIERFMQIPEAQMMGLSREDVSAELRRLRALVSGRLAGGGLVDTRW